MKHVPHRLVAALRSLADLYSENVEKEDKVCFPAARGYFTEAEDQALLHEFWEFDRKMIHEKYILVVEALENQP
ncbi:MAG: hypothetical protein JXD19_05880 [Deltaproteobacteria bacterium]|nr:hypothetical protein [Deltaproteobacteria bacterium]